MIWETLLLGVHVVVAIALIGFVLLQHGKGADMGAAFGSGSSGSLFGSAGSANFLSRSTSVLATVFFLSSLGLTYLASTHVSGASDVMKQGVMQRAQDAAPKATDVPAVPSSGPAAVVPKAPSAPAGTPTPAKDVNSKSGEIPK